MQENWERWEPVFGLSSKYYVESLSDSIEGFRILLSDANDEKKKVEVIFEDSVHAYRSTDESFRQSAINMIDELYGTEFYAEWTFFKVTNSKYIQWLSEQSYGITESESLIHFSILAGDSIVDVIAAYEPKIKKI
ncbi:hypothetical protein KDJ56_20675 [Brevibacillus composti]|uniref:Uncharacterized protein n=1 Tax=Brevibacillus composti TaxID=2796470 RepID=A0A7T5EKH9_9BACL|nr:hypothetical protein [Brevibacillus composti]QQE74225.1 hypothetical protein JD108_20740 [Brevibacillus composti]QUO41307.1 hypothetical protein KDJ56_20675 [Brevibacillus composti]